jgi:hypothetical protein
MPRQRGQEAKPRASKTKQRHRRPQFSPRPLVPQLDPESLGPAMTALPPKLRQFVMEIAVGPLGAGANVRAARAAGLGTPETPDSVMATLAYDTLHTDRVQRALKEVGDKRIVTASFKAIRAVEDIAFNPKHKDQLKAALALMDRGSD